MKQTLAGARWVVLVVAALTVLGFALRLARYQQTVFGDELSTLYGVDGRSLTEVTSYVSSDAEISPPLFFILAWLTTKLGSAPELVRLPSLIAGTVSIPLVYLVGARAINRPAGLIAAGVMALSPFMIFYSADGRGYAVAIALLLGSTLAMLEGARTGNARWWVAYGAFSLLAMYTHYTAAFPLVAQFFWLLWAHPSARRPALIANAAAVVAYLPWISGLAADFDSPTTDILYAIQGSGLAAKLRAIESWAAGYPYVTLSDFLGTVPALLVAVGFVAAAAAGLYGRVNARAAARSELRAPLVAHGMALVIAMAISSGVLALLLHFFTGNDLLSPRTLVASSAGLALLVGAVLAMAGRFWGSVGTVLVAACFGFGAARTLAGENRLPDFKSAAAFINGQAGAHDAIVDAMSTTGITPVPLTPLDAYLNPGRSEYRVRLPEGEPPLLMKPPAPLPDQLRQAVRQARGRSLIVVAGEDGSLVREGDDVTAVKAEPSVTSTFDLPEGSKLITERRFQGLALVKVFEVDVPDDAPRGREPSANKIR